MENAGLGIGARDWGWDVELLVKREEIERKIGEMMKNEKLRDRARKVGEEARKARGTGGSSDKVLLGVIKVLNL